MFISQKLPFTPFLAASIQFKLNSQFVLIIYDFLQKKTVSRAFFTTFYAFFAIIESKFPMERRLL